jgi:hypothetical protein
MRNFPVLDPITVELDLVYPSFAARYLLDVASAGSMKPGNGTLVPIAAGFFRWNATATPSAWEGAAECRGIGPRNDR